MQIVDGQCRVRKWVFLLVLLFIGCVSLSVVWAADPLSGTMSPQAEPAVGQSVLIKANGGTPPYKLSFGAGFWNKGSLYAVKVETVDANTFRVTKLHDLSAQDRKWALISVVDAKGYSAQVANWNGSPSAEPPKPAITVIPSTITVDQSASVKVSGGTPPYTLSIKPETANQVMTATPAGDGSTWTVTAKKDVFTYKFLYVGVAVTDAKGASAQYTLTVNNDNPVPLPSGRPLSALVDTAPLLEGETGILTISGGTPPYNVTTSDSGLQISKTASGAFQIKGLTTGTRSYTVTDSKSKALLKYVTVSPASYERLTAKLANSDIVVGESTKLTISGGNPPYTVKEATVGGVITITPDGSGYKVSGNKPGLAKISVVDKSLNSEVVQLEIRTAMTAIGPSWIFIGDTATFTITGGTAPYTASTSDADAVVSGSGQGPFTMVTKKAGTVTLIIKDKEGRAVSKTIQVKEKTPALDVRVSTDQTPTGDTVTVTVSGGAPPYSYTTSEMTAFTALPAGKTSFTVTFQREGTGAVTVRDNEGNYLSRKVVVTKKILPLAINLADNQMTVGTSQFVTVSGGAGAGYSLQASPPESVVVQQIQADRFNIIARNAGTVTLTARDYQGNTMSRTITVTAANSAPLQVSLNPADTKVIVNMPITATLKGSAPPYQVTGDGSIQFTQTGPNTFQLIPRAIGPHTLTFRSGPQSTSVTFNVVPPGQQIGANLSPDTIRVGQYATLTVQAPGGISVVPGGNGRVRVEQTGQNTFRIIAVAPGNVILTINTSTGLSTQRNLTVTP